MNKVVIKSAKTVDEAVEMALRELGVTQDKVTIDTLNPGKKGFLGLGGMDAKVRVTYVCDDPVSRAEDYLNGIFEKMDAKVAVNSEYEDEKVTVSMDSDEETVGFIIGRRGDHLDALQYLTSLVVNKGEENYIRVSLDIEGYREKREETLIRLAKSKASVVSRTHRSITLEPMNPNERRIIHSTLQDFNNVYTYSVGDDPNRRIVIAPKRKEYSGEYKSKYRYNRKENELVIDGAPAEIYSEEK